MPAVSFKLTKIKQEQFLQHIREGMQRGAATDALFGDDAGSSSAATRRRKMREFIGEHADFEAKVVDAEVEATEHVYEALYQASISGSVSAAKAWIELTGGMPGRKKVAVEPSQNRGAETPPPLSGEPSGDPFADLDNVTPMDPMRRERRGE